MGQIKKTLGKLHNWVKAAITGHKKPKAASGAQHDHHSKSSPKGQKGLPFPLPGKPKIILRADHPISRKQISPNALKVLYRLSRAGFSAFLVGGGVRDLLLNLTPKDFDVATNAKPEEIKKLFSNARLIGKRFRLAHVTFGPETIEVATFRGHHDTARTASGLILSDNTYGSLQEDAERRDFTINSLYYNIADFSIVDYTGGMKDIASRTLRLIGDPETRFREDPVRMLRAARLAAKLDLHIEPQTAKWIPKLAILIQQISHARLADELLKLFLTGKAWDSWTALDKNMLLPAFLPRPYLALSKHAHLNAFIKKALSNTDERILQGKSVTVPFLYACLIWPAVYDGIHLVLKEHKRLFGQLPETIQEETQSQSQITQISRFHSSNIREILELQNRLALAHQRAVFKLEQHPRFRAAYDFLLLRHQTGDPDAQLASWWTEWLTLKTTEQKKEWLKKLPRIKTKRKRK